MSANLSQALETEPDLTHCDREPIHLLGHVQSFGCLISVTSDWWITHVSENCAHILDLNPKDLLGTLFAKHFAADPALSLRAQTQMLVETDDVTRCFALDLFGDGRLFDAAIHAISDGYTFEFEEKSKATPREDMLLVQSLIARVQTTSSLDDMATVAARALRGLTGFDRVMVYQFAQDGTGSVIAEACAPSAERYLGLRFPASDIPRQARELYSRTPLRLISSVNGKTHPIACADDAPDEAIDLSLSVTRAVSPVHLQYLRNMGVKASMSVSIMRRGKLWGLFACHHDTPYYLDYEKRSAAELFVQLFSYELSELLNEEAREHEIEAANLHDRLTARVSRGESLLNDFHAIADEISAAIAFDGIAVYSEGTFRGMGSVPSESELVPLRDFLNTVDDDKVFATDNLARHFPPAAAYADRVAGILVLPISRQPNDYIIICRREISQFVHWAGEPEKLPDPDADTGSLAPRRSFEAWKEVVRGHCAPWSPGELALAGALRLTLVEVLLKVIDAAGHERAQAHRKQEILIAELNHRVRNILNLISGLVSQGGRTAQSVAQHTAVLDGRIQALARAHDQLTRDQWAPVSVRNLIDLEFSAYADPDPERISVDGVDVALSPDASTTVTLLMHELITNSVKHGALSGQSGRVSVSTTQDKDGNLDISWRETGGPPVQPPINKGFGMAIIENSVPFELKGRVDTRYNLRGFEADISIPAKYLHPVDTTSRQPVPVEGDLASVASALDKEVLLVEDNLVIAMHTEDMLRDIGATQVRLASTTSQAMAHLDGAQIGFAVLDVNIGAETSLDVARRLTDTGIPFIVATGYGMTPEISNAYPPSPVLRKPYQKDALIRAVEDAVAKDVISIERRP